MGDVAALPGVAEELRDGSVRQIEQRGIGRDPGTLFLRQLFLLRTNVRDCSRLVATIRDCSHLIDVGDVSFDGVGGD